MKGEEGARLADPRNADIRSRIYFYVDEGRGVTPESNVGPQAHDVDLNNLYDVKADPIGYRKASAGDASKMERLIKQGGFDGYYAPGIFGSQGVAILIGNHSVPVRSLGMGYRGGEAQAPVQSKPAQETDADRVEKARVLPMGEMKGSDWKRMIPAVIPGADVSMLEDGRTYFKSDVVSAMRGAEVRLSPARISPAAQAEIGAIEARNAKSPSALVTKNLDNIKRGLAGEVVRDEQGNLLAPNGKKSKLTEKQYLQVRTPAFKKWFGDWLAFHNAKDGNGVWADGDGAVSKAVDENGEPAVIYHGTERGGFTVMRPEKGDKHRSPMVFATDDRKMARTYSWRGDEIDMSLPEFEGAEARKIGKDWFVVNKGGDGSMAYNVYGDYVDVLDAEGYVSKKEAEYFRDNELEQVFRDNAVVQQGIYSMYLNLRNPMESDFEGANWDGQAPYDTYEVFDGTGDQVYGADGSRYLDLDTAKKMAAENNGEFRDAQDHYETTNSVAEEAKRYGHDGVIIRNVVDDGGKNPGFSVDPATVFVFFDSNQAKSATQNNGRFSLKNNDLRYSPARWYFSPLEKAFESAPDKVFGKAPQVKLWLAANKAKLGIKDDEITWTGINDWLDLQGKQLVSKADVLGYLAGNGVHVEEVLKGKQGYNEDNPTLPKDSALAVVPSDEDEHGDLARRYKYVVVDQSADTAKGWGNTEAEAIADAYSGHPEYWEGADSTKYGQYVLPGGSNYRELLLTLPQSRPLSEIEAEWNNLPVSDPRWQALADERQRALGKDGYRSNHWEEKNILAHIRMNDRVDADGAKTLFIEEVQGDWQQGYRKQVDEISKAVDHDFLGIVERMKQDGVLEVECD